MAIRFVSCDLDPYLYEGSLKKYKEKYGMLKESITAFSSFIEGLAKRVSDLQQGKLKKLDLESASAELETRLKRAASEKNELEDLNAFLKNAIWVHSPSSHPNMENLKQQFPDFFVQLQKLMEFAESNFSTLIFQEPIKEASFNFLELERIQKTVDRLDQLMSDSQKKGRELGDLYSTLAATMDIGGESSSSSLSISTRSPASDSPYRRIPEPFTNYSPPDQWRGLVISSTPPKYSRDLLGIDPSKLFSGLPPINYSGSFSPSSSSSSQTSFTDNPFSWTSSALSHPSPLRPPQSPPNQTIFSISEVSPYSLSSSPFIYPRTSSSSSSSSSTSLSSISSENTLKEPIDFQPLFPSMRSTKKTRNKLEKIKSKSCDNIHEPENWLRITPKAQSRQKINDVFGVTQTPESIGIHINMIDTQAKEFTDQVKFKRRIDLSTFEDKLKFILGHAEEIINAIEEGHPIYLDNQIVDKVILRDRLRSIIDNMQVIKDFGRNRLNSREELERWGEGIFKNSGRWEKIFHPITQLLVLLHRLELRLNLHGATIGHCTKISIDELNYLIAEYAGLGWEDTQTASEK